LVIFTRGVSVKELVQHGLYVFWERLVYPIAPPCFLVLDEERLKVPVARVKMAYRVTHTYVNSRVLEGNSVSM